MARLADAAIGSVRVASLPVTLRLVNVTPASDDVFGYWSSGQRPVRGRDRLVRGWDRWLAHLAQHPV